MKIADVKNDVSVGGAQSINAFTIKASAKAFEILSSNLYSNKIGSMIRELSTNAYDAHVMVNKPNEPFIITLPNTFDPTFKIRDFGPGLSEKEITTIYTTFFESTKTDSNDVVGCLGLGSKSPFGISDSFTINSYYNGTKTIYSAFLNDLRIPSIAKFIDLQTDEPNGIEVEVAVKEPDFFAFAKEVNVQLKYFKTKPIIQGDSSFEWELNETYLIDTPNWKLIRHLSPKVYSEPKILQGQIAYPITVADMGKEFNEASDLVKALLTAPLLIEVPIGTVNITPSREALTYDLKTTQNIIAAAESILKEIADTIKTTIINCDTEYEARLRRYEILINLDRGYEPNALSKYLETADINLWQNKDITTLDILIEKEKIISAVSFFLSYSSKFNKTVYYSGNLKPHNWKFHISPLDKLVWVYCTPNDKQVESKAKQYINDNYPNKRMQFIVINTNMTFEECAAQIGIKSTQLINANTLDKVRRIKAAPTNVPKKITLAKYNHSLSGYYTNSGNVASLFESCEITSNHKLAGYYVDIKNFVIQHNDVYQNINNFKNLIKGAITLGLITENDNIYAIKPNQKRPASLINLFDHFKQKIQTIQLKPYYVFSQYSGCYKILNELPKFEKYKKKLSKSSPFKEILNILAEHKKHDDNVSMLLTVMNLHNLVDMTDKSKEIDRMYPLISLTSYYLDESVPLIVDYIVQMDKLREFENAAAGTNK